jgi:hypothetical protein
MLGGSRREERTYGIGRRLGRVGVHGGGGGMRFCRTRAAGRALALPHGWIPQRLGVGLEIRLFATVVPVGGRAELPSISRVFPPFSGARWGKSRAPRLVFRRWDVTGRVDTACSAFYLWVKAAFCNKVFL